MGNKLYMRHTMSDQHSTLGSIGHKKSMRMLSSDLKYPCHPYDLDMIYIYRYSFCLSPRTMPSVRFELTKLYATDLKSASFDRSEKMAVLRLGVEPRTQVSKTRVLTAYTNRALVVSLRHRHFFLFFFYFFKRDKIVVR